MLWLFNCLHYVAKKQHAIVDNVFLTAVIMLQNCIYKREKSTSSLSFMVSLAAEIFSLDEGSVKDPQGVLNKVNSYYPLYLMQ